MSNESRPRFVFICSAGHSGSTLLDMLLGANREVESLGEITHLPKNIALNSVCTCGAPVRECELWKAAIAELSRHLNTPLLANPYALDLGFIDSRVVKDDAHQTRRYRSGWKFLLGSYYLSLRAGVPLWPGLARRLDRMVENNHQLYEIVLRLRGKSIVVDSSKSYLKAIAFYRRYPDTTRIIVLVRDGRGVFFSGVRRGAGLRAAYDAWANHYARALPLYQRLVAPEHVIFVRYETLVATPRDELQRICRLLRTSYEETMLDPSKAEYHVTNGNDMRFRAGPIRLDEKWRTELTAGELRYFNERGGKLNSSLGYRQ